MAIAQCLRRKGVNLDQKSVCSDRYSPSAKPRKKSYPPASLARIHNHRKMGFFFGDGHRREIQRIPRIGFEGAYSTFTKQDVRVSFRENIFGREQPLLDPLVHSSFE